MSIESFFADSQRKSESTDNAFEQQLEVSVSPEFLTRSVGTGQELIRNLINPEFSNFAEQLYENPGQFDGNFLFKLLKKMFETIEYDQQGELSFALAGEIAFMHDLHTAVNVLVSSEHEFAAKAADFYCRIVIAVAEDTKNWLFFYEHYLNPEYLLETIGQQDLGSVGNLMQRYMLGHASVIDQRVLDQGAAEKTRHQVSETFREYILMLRRVMGQDYQLSGNGGRYHSVCHLAFRAFGISEMYFDDHLRPEIFFLLDHWVDAEPGFSLANMANLFDMEHGSPASVARIWVALPREHRLDPSMYPELFKLLTDPNLNYDSPEQAREILGNKVLFQNTQTSSAIILKFVAVFGSHGFGLIDDAKAEILRQAAKLFEEPQAEQVESDPKLSSVIEGLLKLGQASGALKGVDYYRDTLLPWALDPEATADSSLEDGIEVFSQLILAWVVKDPRPSKLFSQYFDDISRIDAIQILTPLFNKLKQRQESINYYREGFTRKINTAFAYQELMNLVTGQDKPALEFVYKNGLVLPVSKTLITISEEYKGPRAEVLLKYQVTPLLVIRSLEQLSWFVRAGIVDSSFLRYMAEQMLKAVLISTDDGDISWSRFNKVYTSNNPHLRMAYLEMVKLVLPQSGYDTAFMTNDLYPVLRIWATNRQTWQGLSLAKLFEKPSLARRWWLLYVKSTNYNSLVDVWQRGDWDPLQNGNNPPYVAKLAMRVFGPEGFEVIPQSKVAEVNAKVEKLEKEDIDGSISVSLSGQKVPVQVMAKRTFESNMEARLRTTIQKLNKSMPFLFKGQNPALSAEMHPLTGHLGRLDLVYDSEYGEYFSVPISNASSDKSVQLEGKISFTLWKENPDILYLHDFGEDDDLQLPTELMRVDLRRVNPNSSRVSSPSVTLETVTSNPFISHVSLADPVEQAVAAKPDFSNILNTAEGITDIMRDPQTRQGLIEFVRACNQLGIETEQQINPFISLLDYAQLNSVQSVPYDSLDWPRPSRGHTIRSEETMLAVHGEITEQVTLLEQPIPTPCKFVILYDMLPGPDHIHVAGENLRIRFFDLADNFNPVDESISGVTGIDLVFDIEDEEEPRLEYLTGDFPTFELTDGSVVGVEQELPVESEPATAYEKGYLNYPDFVTSYTFELAPGSQNISDDEIAEVIDRFHDEEFTNLYKVYPRQAHLVIHKNPGDQISVRPITITGTNLEPPIVDVIGTLDGGVKTTIRLPGVIVINEDQSNQFKNKFYTESGESLVEPDALTTSMNREKLEFWRGGTHQNVELVPHTATEEIPDEATPAIEAIQDLLSLEANDGFSLETDIENGYVNIRIVNRTADSMMLEIPEDYGGDTGISSFTLNSQGSVWLTLDPAQNYESKGLKFSNLASVDIHEGNRLIPQQLDSDDLVMPFGLDLAVPEFTVTGEVGGVLELSVNDSQINMEHEGSEFSLADLVAQDSRFRIQQPLTITSLPGDKVAHIRLIFNSDDEQITRDMTLEYNLSSGRFSMIKSINRK